MWYASWLRQGLLLEIISVTCNTIYYGPYIIWALYLDAIFYALFLPIKGTRYHTSLESQPLEDSVLSFYHHALEMLQKWKVFVAHCTLHIYGSVRCLKITNCIHSGLTLRKGYMHGEVCASTFAFLSHQPWSFPFFCLYFNFIF